MSKGRFTIPTDESFVEGTKIITEKWGADAVRDCDGTRLPKNAGQYLLATRTPIFSMICVEGDFVRTCRTGNGKFGKKRENSGVRAGSNAISIG